MIHQLPLWRVRFTYDSAVVMAGQATAKGSEMVAARDLDTIPVILEREYPYASLRIKSIRRRKHVLLPEPGAESGT